MRNASDRWSRPEERTRLRARRSPRVAMTVDVTFVEPEVGDRSHVRDFGIPTASDARVHDPTAIIGDNVVGQYLGQRVPVAGREVRPEALGHLACRVFQPRRRPTELVEPRKRGVDVCLVEHLAAVDQVAFDRQKVDHPPLGVEALLRGPMCRLGDDRSEVAQPMHSLDVDLDVRRVVPGGAGCMRSCRRART